MGKRLGLSRPRPIRGAAELDSSWALRLLAWHEEQFHRGWQLSQLPALTAEDLEALQAVRKQLGRLCLYCELVKQGGEG